MPHFKGITYNKSQTKMLIWIIWMYDHKKKVEYKIKVYERRSENWCIIHNKEKMIGNRLMWFGHVKECIRDIN